VQVITEELSTALATVAIENSEELDLELWLLIAVRLDARLFQVKHDRNTVFIVIPHEAVMSVGSVGDHIWHERPLGHFCFLEYRSSDVRA
jgi:hypothetical protein